MDQNLIVDKEYWIKKNPDIVFKNTSKAFYGEYLLKTTLNITGTSIRYYKKNFISYDDFLDFLDVYLGNFGGMITNIDENDCYLVETSLSQHKVIYNAKILYQVYKLLHTVPDDLKLMRTGNLLHIYSNDFNAITRTINQLGVDDNDIKFIGYPKPDDLKSLISGREITQKAKNFNYKIMLKNLGRQDLKELYNYLIQFEESGDIGITDHCKNLLKGTEPYGWVSSIPYFYIKDYDMVLIINMLAKDRFSKCTELVMPSD